ncbi:MAG: epoxyqueuosine reductase [Candidatus Merdivicinus sp.]|jgi:epoxyqueuosine reductase
MDRIRPYLQEAGITEAGSVPFASCLPLLECRAKARLPQNAASVIICALPYYTGEWPGRNLSRYAIVPDYHTVSMQLLKPVCERLTADFGAKFEPFADNSPIREVDAAARAGLGVVGENGLLLTTRYGSWVFLAEIVTDLSLSYTEQPVKHCIACGNCRKACPSGCITDGKIDPDRCLSAITQTKRDLTPEEIALIRKGGLIWGCDRCQEVCPYNQHAEETPLSAFREEIHPVFTSDDLDGSLKTRACGFRGPKPLQRNLEILKTACQTEESVLY